MTNADDSAEKQTIIDLDADQVSEVNETVSREQPSNPERRQGRPGRMLLGSAAALAIAAAGGGWLYKDVLSSYFPSDTMKAAQIRIQTLEASNKSLQDEVVRIAKLADAMNASLNALEAKTGEIAASAADANTAAKGGAGRLATLDAGLAEAKQALAALDEKIASLPQGASSTVIPAGDAGALSRISSRVADLEKDVASLKSSRGQGSENVAALSQALSDLKAKIAAGAGYGPELERVQAMAPAAPGLDVLALSAAQGLPNAKGLVDELMVLAQTFPKPVAPIEQDDGSMLAGAWKTLSGLVRVRSIGEADWQAAAVSAATLTGQGELQRAIDVLNAVDDAKPAGLEQWIAMAAGRAHLEAALNDVSDAVMRVIAAKG